MIVVTDENDAMSFQSALSDSFHIDEQDNEDDISSCQLEPSDRSNSEPPATTNHLHRKRTAVSSSSVNTTTTIQHYTFNQDRSCIAMALADDGFRIHTLPSAQDWYHKHPDTSLEILWSKTNVHQSNPFNTCILICMLHETSLLAIVPKDSPRTVLLIHAKLGTTLQQLSFQNAILRVEMNRSTLVCLTCEGKLHCFSFFIVLLQDPSSSSSLSSSSIRSNQLDDIHLIHRFSIPILAPNENARLLLYSPHAMNQGAFFDLSSHCVQGHSWLVTRSDMAVGHVSIYDTVIHSEDGGCKDPSDTPAGWILTRKAHDHSITRIAVGLTIFATASQKGTMVRVFRISDGELLNQLSRGTTPCPILSLILNPSNTIVAVCSAHNTIHLFRLYDIERKRNPTIFQGVVMNRLMSSWAAKTVPSSPQHCLHRPVSRIHLNRVISTTQHIITLLDVDASSCNYSYPTLLMLCTEKGEMLQYEIAVSADGLSTVVRLLHTKNVLHS